MAASKIPVEFSEWRPDVATLDTKFATEVENVFAGVNSYLPFPSLVAFTAASLANAGNDQFTKVLLQFNGGLADENVGGSPHTWTAAGNAAYTTGDYRFAPGSLALDGTGDWLTTPAHADYNFGAQDFTVECWFKCTATGGTDEYLMGQTSAAGIAANTSFFIFRTQSNVMQATVSNGTGNLSCRGTTQFTNLLNPGWHHLAFVRTGSTLKLFIDGIQEGNNFTIGPAAVNSSSNALRIGARGELTTDTWTGGVDELRISVGVARYTVNFAVAQAPYFTGGGRPCGLYSARTSDGSWKIFAGTTEKLFTWSLAGWTDVSRTTGGSYSVPPTEMWVFEQSGPHLIAVNVNDDPQVINIDSGSNFAALAGSPPRAGHVKQLGDFLFLSRLDEAPGLTNRTIIWSAINDIESWDIGLNLCDMQEFPDNGPVQGIAGGEIGYVLQDRGIRTVQFLPGDTTFIFNFSRVLHDRGCVSKFGFAAIGNVLYFLSEDGFYTITGQQVTPIGTDKVNDWFLANSDVGRRDVVHCIASVNKPRMVWVYHYNSASPMYDRQIYFDWSNGRWAKASVAAEVWGLLASPGLDLDTTGDEFEDVLLDSAARSLDSFAYVGGRPLIGAIDGNGMLATLAGPNLQATMETAEMHLAPGQRAFVDEVYPLDDADAPGTVSTGTRERLQGGLPTWTAPVEVEQSIGSAFVMTSARLHRFRRSIPYAATWTHAQGVLVNAQQDGTVA